MFQKAKKKEGRKNIGTVTLIKILTIECIEFAWQSQPAGFCWWLCSFLVLYYIFLTLVAFKRSLPAVVSSSFLLKKEFIFPSSNQKMVCKTEKRWLSLRAEESCCTWCNGELEWIMFNLCLHNRHTAKKQEDHFVNFVNGSRNEWRINGKTKNVFVKLCNEQK